MPFKTLEEKRAYNREYARRMYQRLRADGVCCSCRKQSAGSPSVFCAACLEAANERSRSYTARLREEALAAYGGRCACCGETESLFLCIDHVRGNGNVHRRDLGGGKRARSGRKFYKWLKDRDYPEGFQLLCYNCNNGRHLNGGGCSHRVKTNA